MLIWEELRHVGATGYQRLMLHRFKKANFERDNDVPWPVHAVLDPGEIARFRNHVLSRFAKRGIHGDIPDAMYACIQETVQGVKKYVLVEETAQNVAAIRALLLPGPLESHASSPAFFTLDDGEHVYTCTIDEFIRYMDDIWYPSSNDLMCSMPALDACVGITHDERVFIV